MGATPVRTPVRSRKRQRAGTKFDLRDTKVARSSQTHLKILQQVTNTGPRGDEAKKEPFDSWDLPPEATVREKPPESVRVASRAEFDRIVSAGAFASQSEAGDPLWVVIGLDFGTSCTKVIARMPYEAGEPTFAVPAPDYCRSAGHPYLWQTAVWIRRSDEFIAYPEKGARLLQTLKQGIMGKHPNAPLIQSSDQKSALTRLDAVSAYLTYVIRYVRGWLVLKHPKLFRGRQTLWFVNLGLAAAYYDNEELFQTYRNAAAAALMVANSGGAVSVETLRTFRGHEAVVKATQSDDDAEKLGITVIPETAAAATAFAKSRHSATGLYLMVDVGAMTLDVCSFMLNKQKTGADQCPLLEVDVQPLGVEAFHWFRDSGRTKEDFDRRCRRCLGKVVVRTRDKRAPSVECWEAGSELPVFLMGGGSQNTLHLEIVEALHQWMQRFTKNEGLRRLELPVPKSIKRPEPLSHLGRMAVAFGLSYLPTEICQITLPSNIEDLEPRSKDYLSRFVSKDET